MSQFNVSRIVDAIVVAHAASWVIPLTEERVAFPKVKADKIIDAMTAALSDRVTAGDLDAGSAKVYLSSARTMLECPLDTLLDAVAEGYGINGVLRRIRAATGNRSTRGRPAGQGKGKSTKSAEAAEAAEAAESTPTVVNNDRAWKLFIEDMRAKVPARKDWAAADITAFQECTMMLLTIIKRNAK